MSKIDYVKAKISWYSTQFLISLVVEFLITAWLVGSLENMRLPIYLLGFTALLICSAFLIFFARNLSVLFSDLEAL